MSKYKALNEFLIASGENTIVITFDEIANIINTNLPASAFKHRAWWSNNESNSVITRAWLDAGYKTRNVNMEKLKLEFHKNLTEERPQGFGDKQLTHGREVIGEAPSGDLLSRVSGILKGTVTIYSDTDLTEPLAEEWNALK